MTTVVPDSAMASTPRPTEEIQKQLAELVQAKNTASSHGVIDFASRMGMESICGHEESLREELKAAEMLESGSDLELSLNGDPVHGHQVQAGFLGSFLNKTQQLVNALAQALTSTPTARASIPRNIVAENRLMVTGFAPSSFAIRLRLPTKEELEQVFEPDSQTVLDMLGRMIGESMPSEQVKELVTLPRVKKHFYELLETIAKAGAELRYRTRQCPIGVSMKAKQARDRVEWLDLLQVQEEKLELEGVLVGGSIESARFELKTEEEIYRGKVSDPAIAAMKSITFGATVVVQLRATTMTHEEGAVEPNTSYFLTHIQPAVNNSDETTA